MRRRKDDLTAWQDDPVVQALTAPGTADELAGEAGALAAFRAAVPTRSRRRFAGRLGVGGSTLAIAIAFSGGVAAAYTAALPSQVQRVFNDVGGWAGIPAPTAVHHKHSARGHHGGTPSPGVQQALGQLSTPPVAGAPTPAPTPTPTSTPTPKAKPSGKQSGGGRPSTSPSSSPTTVASSPPPSTSPTPTTTPTPTPTLTPPVLGSITITLSASSVPVDGSVTVLGRLATSTGEPIAGHRIWLMEWLTGQSTLSQVDMGLTGSDGSVDLTAGDLTHSVRLRLVSGQGVRSAPVLVVVMPTVSATLSVQGSSYDASITTDGAQQGDVVMLQRRARTGWVGVATMQLDASGDALFAVPVPAQRPVRYRVVLPRTQAHGYAATRFVTPPT